MKYFYESCQVFTPSDVVKYMLDKINYKKNLFGKKILENSCGDGHFLVEIVERYINDCIVKNYDNNKIVFGLENDIYGIEIDSKHYLNCKKNLDDLTKKYGLNNVKWNLLQEDALKYYFPFKFDYVVGNPPYITYSNLDEDTRSFIKNSYEVCKKGKPDYYYAFIENSIKNLNSNGIMAYLVPNNVFKNTFAEELREYIKPTLKSIYDYDNMKIFEGKLTTSTIIVCQLNNNSSDINYCNISKNENYVVDKRRLTNKWNFVKSDILFNNKKRRFGDYYNVSISIATQCNKAFICSDYCEDENYIVVDNIKIEKEIMRRATSPRTINKKNELIIFPYLYSNNKLIKIRGFEEKYPFACRYLSKFKNDLLSRKSDKNANWYEYGRSQALQHLNQEKLMMSTIFTNKVRVYSLDKNTIPYSGIYITSKGENSLDEAMSIMTSDEFLEYLKVVGIQVNGTSVRISPSDIKNYTF